MRFKGQSKSLRPIAGWMVVALLVIVAPAAAHPGHGSMSGFAAGLQHPLSGIDHLLAMIAVGLWAGSCGGRRAWLWPAIFVSSMVAGGVIGLYVATTMPVESAILTSVLVLGLATTFRLRAPLLLGGMMIAVFGLAHGFAHGSEMPHSVSGLDFAAGLIVATSALHLMGLMAATSLRRLRLDYVTRFAGMAIVIAGITFILGV